MPADFRQQAEARLEQLDREERERRVAAEERRQAAAATAAADADRRRREQVAAAERAEVEARARLGQMFGTEAADRISLNSEVYLFSLEHRAAAIAIRREPATHHPGGRARRAPALVAGPRTTSWQEQLRLQRVLGVGVDMPTITRADKLAEVAGGLHLLVDPTDGELVELRNGWAER